MTMISQGLSLSLDPASLKVISDLQNSGPLLEANLTFAMRFAVSTLINSMQDNMQTGFKNPQGPLEDSITPNVTPYLSTITMGQPYDWRREEGFSGMTDSLGRTFTNDPGIQYAANAMSSNKSAISRMFEEAIGSTALGISM